MQPTITHILESEKEVYCGLDTKLQRHGNCLSLIDDFKVFIVHYIHGKMDGTGYLLDHGQVLHEFVFSKGDLESTNSYSAESGVIDIDTGTRFEGLIYKEKPYGYGELFDDDGNKIYEGILINWKRCGYGISYNSNGIIKYDGYWFDNKHHGPGVKNAINGDVIASGSFINNNFVNSGYSGDGKGLNSSLTHIVLTYPTSLNEIRFQGYAFERISITNNYSCKIGKCSITNMPALRSLDIRNNCFTEKASILNIENCPVLNSISIGENSFTKYSLKINSIVRGVVCDLDLPELKTFESESKSFREAKLVIFQGEHRSSYGL